MGWRYLIGTDPSHPSIHQLPDHATRHIVLCPGTDYGFNLRFKLLALFMMASLLIGRVYQANA